MKIRVINVLPHCPGYEAYLDCPRPRINWDTSDGSWVGIWGYDWPDILGIEVLKISRDFEYEVWQPDNRADKVYAAELVPGVSHKLFPVEKGGSGLFSGEVFISSLCEAIENGCILNLNDLSSAYSILMSVRNYYIRNHRSKAMDWSRVPIVLTGHGSNRMPIYRLRKLKKLWRIPSILMKEYNFRKMLAWVDVMTEQQEKLIGEFKKVFKGRIEKTTMGCDFDFWYPAPVNYDRSWFYQTYKCTGKKVFLNVSNFSPVKQLDRLIAGFEALSHRDDFFLLLVGHGTHEYETYLKNLGKNLIEKGLMAFCPYTRGERLRDLFWAADYYINTSLSEGGPVSVFQALGCGLPTIVTETGVSAEFLIYESAGFILPLVSKENWVPQLSGILNGRSVPVASREECLKWFSWKNVGLKYVEIYQDLWNLYSKFNV